MSNEANATQSQNETDYVDVAAVDDLDPEEPRRVEVAGTPLLLVRTGVEIFALSPSCTHETQPLDEGFVEDGYIECPRHGARFDLRSGAALNLPATRGLSRYPVRLEDGRVLVSPRPKE